MADITGTAQGVGDNLRGTGDDDVIKGLSGDDVIKAGGGDDEIQGGRGNDVMAGGQGADTFVFSAGHIGDGETDYITDFSVNQGDALKFLDSGSGAFNVVSVELEKRTETENVNGVDLRNNVEKGTDIVFTVQNDAGDTQEIVLLDAWSKGLNSQWEDILAEMGLTFGIQESEGPEPCELHSIGNDEVILVDDCLLAF